MQVVSKLEFEFRTLRGARGNFGFEPKWILTTPQSCAASSCQSANVRLDLLTI